MSTWILLLLVAMGEGAAGFQVEGFESKADCDRAAAVATQALKGFLISPRHACIERKATR